MKAAACIIASAILTAAWVAFRAWPLAFVAGLLNGVAVGELQRIGWLPRKRG